MGPAAEDPGCAGGCGARVQGTGAKKGNGKPRLPLGGADRETLLKRAQVGVNGLQLLVGGRLAAKASVGKVRHDGRQ